jgi:hypothetical protein
MAKPCWPWARKLDHSSSRNQLWQSVLNMSPPGGEKGSAARRRPKVGREAYSLYVERPAEGANDADGPLSAAGTGWPC